MFWGLHREDFGAFDDVFGNSLAGSENEAGPLDARPGGGAKSKARAGGGGGGLFDSEDEDEWGSEAPLGITPRPTPPMLYESDEDKDAPANNKPLPPLSSRAPLGPQDALAAALMGGAGVAAEKSSGGLTATCLSCVGGGQETRSGTFFLLSTSHQPASRSSPHLAAVIVVVTSNEPLWTERFGFREFRRLTKSMEFVHRRRRRRRRWAVRRQ